MQLPESDDNAERPVDAPAEAGGEASEARPWKPVFPEALGIGLIATLVVGLVGVCLFALLAVKRQQRDVQMSEGQALARAVSMVLGRSADLGNEAVGSAFYDLCTGNESLRWAVWSAPDGSVRFCWPPSAGAGQSVNAPSGHVAGAGMPPAGSPGERLLYVSAPVRTDEGAPAGSVRLGLAIENSAEAGTLLVRGCVLVAVAALSVFFVLYRRLRRHLRPLDAIQRSLHNYETGIEREFVALSLSDSLGRVAEAWNHLIDQVAELRGQQRDTSAQDLADAALQRFESRTLRSTLDRLPIGLLRFGQDQRVTYANVAAGRLLGHPVGELVGMPLMDAIDEEVRAPLVGAYLRSAAAMSIDRKRGDDDQQTTLRFALIPAASSSPDSDALVTIEDVSHLQEADRARDNFLYHVTHELRTPLTNVQAYAETLTGPGFDDEQTRRECYNVIISETRRLSRLVEDILNISQLEVGTARVDVDTVDLVRLLRQTVQDHLGAADEKQIDLTLKLAPKVPRVRGDKQRLSVLMTNLIGNAVKYTPEGGRVEVTLEVGERCLEIAVADTGIGIAPEDQRHIFDKFYRAASDYVQTVAGTGLGLAIAREIARLHGGDIRLESKPGEGSRFVVELPRPESES